jgi:hypothetical protein
MYHSSCAVLCATVTELCSVDLAKAVLLAQTLLFVLKRYSALSVIVKRK